MRLVLDWLVMIGTFGGKVLRFGAILLVENPKHMIGQLSETSVSKFGAAVSHSINSRLNSNRNSKIQNTRCKYLKY